MREVEDADDAVDQRETERDQRVESAEQHAAVLVLDRSDDPLNPTRGWKGEVRVEPTALTGDQGLLYTRAVVQGSTYFAFGKEANTVAAVRLRLGSIIGPLLAGDLKGMGYSAAQILMAMVPLVILTVVAIFALGRIRPYGAPPAAGPRAGS